MIATRSPTHTLEWIVNGLQDGGEASSEVRATRALGRNILLVGARADEAGNRKIFSRYRGAREWDLGSVSFGGECGEAEREKNP